MNGIRLRTLILATGILCLISIKVFLLIEPTNATSSQIKHAVNATPCMLAAPELPSKSASKSTVAYAPKEWVDEIKMKIEPRIWKVRKSPLPCHQPQRLNWEAEFRPYTWATKTTPRQPIPPATLISGTGGMFFVKPMKVGGSTAAGVHLRIMHNTPKKQKKAFPVCRGNFRHGDANLYSSVTDQSLLWTVVRDPTARSISQFFHYSVSRSKVEPTDKNFQTGLLQGGVAQEGPVLSRPNNEALDQIAPSGLRDSYYANIMKLNDETTSVRETLASILSAYDFIAVTERLDESFLVMKHLWQLDWGDILYLNAKQQGAFDAGGSSNGCTWIAPGFVSKKMQEFFSTEEWLKRIKWDFAFHSAVNASLDLTINHVIGRDLFEQDLQKFRAYLSVVEKECVPKAIVPCSGNSRFPLPSNMTNCLWSDSACSNDCLDEIANRIVQESR